MSLEQLREEHRRWLGKHNLLDRPWFVLGSAPDPTIPPGITDRAALVCINNSGATAQRLGLPPAALTVRAKHKEWRSVRDCRLPVVLLVSDNPLHGFARKWISREPQIDVIRSMTRRVRREIFTHFLGDDLRNVGQKHKPSMGIFTVHYGLFVGVPEIILSGISLSKDGYSYGSLPGIQKHRDEDRLSLTLIRDRHQNVLTTERDLSEMIGIPVFA